MKKLWFVTPGAFPLDAFTTFGTNVKPNTTTPIGHFGTGLKYAVAITLRLGGNVTLFTGGAEYGFYLERKEFRGKTFNRVRMRSRKLLPLTKWRSVQLPFTTELGKDWKAWQAYRELASNTMDENGWVQLPALDHERNAHGITPEHSILEIESNDIYDAQTEAFLPPDRPIVWEDSEIEIRSGGSKHMFFRGIRVQDLRYPSRFTYNWKTGVQLSEDRTASNIWLLFWKLQNKIKDQVDDPKFLAQLVRKEKEQTLEGEDLSFNYDEEEKGSRTFHSTVAALGRSGDLSRSAGTYFAVSSRSLPKTTSISFTQEEWRMIADALDAHESFPDTPRGQSILTRIRSTLIYITPEEVPF